MLKLIFSFLVLTSPIAAQSVDLGKIPEGYSFVSVSEDSTVMLRYIGRSGEVFEFEEAATYADGTQDIAQVWVNRFSQTIAWSVNGSKTRYAPNDCAPSVGECIYTWFHPDGTFEMKKVTYMVGDVFVSDEYFKDGEVWSFWERACTTYDEFGFWIDFVRILSAGETDYGARERPEGNRLNELWNICQPERLTS